MTDDLRGGSLGDVDLVAALVDLGERLAYPSDPGPEFDRALAAAIQDGAAQRARRTRAFHPPRAVRAFRLRGASGSRARRAFVLAVVIVVLTAVATAAATFTVRGVRLIFGPPPASAPTGPATHRTAPPLGSELFLGEHMTLAEARSRLRFPIEVPTLAGIGRPEVYVSQVAAGGVFNVAYPPLPGAPSTAGGHGVGVLISEFVGRLDRPLMQKFIDRGTSVEPVDVGSSPGLWVSGEPHEAAYLGPNGSLITDSLRLSANALLWQHGAVTLRVETALPLDRALAIARSMG